MTFVPRGNQQSRNPCRVTEEPTAGRNDGSLLPAHVNTPAVSLTHSVLGYVSWFTCLACFLRTQAQQVLFNTCRFKLLCQKLMGKAGVLILCAFGATIDFEHTSATYNRDKARSNWNWIRLWNYAQPPDVILEAGAAGDTGKGRGVFRPNMTPGNCWAFEGDHGQVTIRLAQKVYLSNLTVQHIPKTISLSGSLDTAPKDFVIYGMESSPGEEVFLGAFQFQPENTIQMFPLQNQQLRAFGAVKVKISSNWGNPHFTCLYRVRVHGSVALPTQNPAVQE
ncbi:SUN domain-containing protein 5 [Fukomys damarensis]|uniref:SUN domain-containing protein 5 n=1 Tax=Fukomys damarensis TaxID=885580 RepID=A0A091DK59_FUKDA|nr:SUN domain-containing protein 5 [Fukomys damarensis]